MIYGRVNIKAYLFIIYYLGLKKWNNSYNNNKINKGI